MDFGNYYTLGTFIGKLLEEKKYRPCLDIVGYTSFIIKFDFIKDSIIYDYIFLLPSEFKDAIEKNKKIGIKKNEKNEVLIYCGKKSVPLQIICKSEDEKEKEEAFNWLKKLMNKINKEISPESFSLINYLTDQPLNAPDTPHFKELLYDHIKNCFSKQNYEPLIITDTIYFPASIDLIDNKISVVPLTSSILNISVKEFEKLKEIIRHALEIDETLLINVKKKYLYVGTDDIKPFKLPKPEDKKFLSILTKVLERCNDNFLFPY